MLQAAQALLVVLLVTAESAWAASFSRPSLHGFATAATLDSRQHQHARGRGATALEAGRKHTEQWWPMQELSQDRAMLVLVRHGQSEWNFANRFIGWYDSPLTEEGEWEADDAGSLLRDNMLEVDEVHTSMLTRTVDTARRALAKMREAGLRVPGEESLQCSWRLNERSYGALTGRNKKECTKEYGKEQLKLWRRSWDVPPPQYEDDCETYQEETAAFHSKVAAFSKQGLFNPEEDPPPEELPRGESLKMTQERLLPYWEQTLLPRLQEGRRVMVFGHENNLRALVMLLDGIGEEDILEVDIPRAMPLVYMFRRDKLLRDTGIPRLEPVLLRPPDAAAGSEKLSARYLVDAELINALHQRDVMQVYDTNVEENLEEVCIIEDVEDMDGPNMCQTIDEYLQGEDDESPERLFIVDRREPKGGKADLAFLSPLPRRRWKVPRAPPAAAPPTGAAAGLGFGQGQSNLISSASASLLLLLGSASLVLSPQARSRTKRTRLARLTRLLRRAHAEELEEEEDLLALFEEFDKGSDDTPDHGDTMEGDAVNGVEGDICELIGFDLGPDLDRQIGRSFNEEERQEAYRESGFMRARPAEQPQALWLIGPSASGKSTLAPLAASWVGVEPLDYVVIDGEAFRDSHRGYQDALHEGNQKGCVWWGAYVGIRENVNKEKQKLLAHAVKDSKNLIIPSTCLRKSQCVDVAERLLRRGYLVHIVGIYGDKEEIVGRGQKRAKEKGKRYDPREFCTAIRQFAPMLRLCNGRYFVVCTTDGRDSMVPTWQGEAPVPEDEIQKICHEVLVASNAEECEV